MSEDKKQLARVALKQRAVLVEEVGPYETSAEDLQALGEKFGVPALDLARVRFPLALLELIPREIAERHRLLPVKTSGEVLHVAMENPADAKAIDELSFVVGKQVVPLAVPAIDLTETLQAAYLAARRGDSFFEGPRFQGPEPRERTGDGARDPSPEHPFEIPDLDLGGEKAVGQTSTAIPTPATKLVPAKAPEARQASSAKTSPLVLVVDDDQAVLALMKDLLLGHGYRVISARDGREAIECLERENPALLVLDVLLPGMHGFEIVRRLQASGRSPKVPVVIVSGVHRGWEVAEDMRKLGVVGHVEKPFRATRFLRTIEAALGVRSNSISSAASEQLTAGLAALKEGKSDQALQHLSRAVELEPEAPALHFHLGLLLGKRGQLFDAITSLERALEFEAVDFACTKNLAILYQQAGFINKSIELWQRALHLAPDDTTRDSIKERVRSLFG